MARPIDRRPLLCAPLYLIYSIAGYPLSVARRPAYWGAERVDFLFAFLRSAFSAIFLRLRLIMSVISAFLVIFSQQISDKPAISARPSPAGFGKKIFLAFFSLDALRAGVGERIFFPKALLIWRPFSGEVLKKTRASAMRATLKKKAIAP